MSEIDEQVVDATMSDEELELDLDLDDNEDVDWKAEAEKKAQFARQAVARAKKAEAELKELKAPKKEDAPQINNTQVPYNPDDIDEKILKAQGVSQEEINYLKKIAKVNGTSVIDAQSDDLFLAFKSKKEADTKAQQARLGASKGSGSVKKEKGFNTPGLTEEEHKAKWKEQMGL